MTIQAVSTTEDAQIWLRNAHRIRVLNISKHAWNLADEHDHVISIVASTVGNGPLNIVVPLPELSALTELETVYSAPYNLGAAGIIIDTATTPVWNAILRLPSVMNIPEILWIGKKLLEHSADSLAQPYLNLPPVQSYFQRRLLTQLSEAAQAVIDALQTQDNAALLTATQSLAGKGIGLTPAGDDWLLGCVAALHCLGYQEKINLMVNAACSQTTLFSGAHLKMAGSGKYAQPWHQLFRAEISQQVRTAILYLLQYGHTSGADALTGFIQGFEMLSAPAFDQARYI
ncbi:MAG: DUF2877 domain-containing protein [Anaerolineae bacterium]|nr:DUF2877 domain-containing protein [Anaerolineae bacterium]